MSNLNINLKKYFVGKLLDTIVFAIFIIGVYYFLPKLAGSTIMVVLALALLITAFFLVQKYIGKKMDKWDVPEMDMAELKKYNFADTWLFIVIAAILIYLLGPSTDYIILTIFFVVVIGLKEWGKWKQYKQAVKEEVGKGGEV